jgi:glutamate formiminotransferase
VLDLERTPVHRAFEAVTREAAAQGVEVVAGELVGLVPRIVLTAAEEAGVELPGIDESRVLEGLVEH